MEAHQAGAAEVVLKLDENDSAIVPDDEIEAERLGEKGKGPLLPPRDSRPLHGPPPG